MSTSPMLPFVHFDLPTLLQTMVSRHFLGLEVTVSASFARASLLRAEPLASITVGDRTAEIRIHECLNRNDTPREVIEFILGHELIHISIPSREIDGRVVPHPSEFWDTELRPFPNRSIVWAWLHTALWLRLKLDKRREQTMIRRGWQNDVHRRFPTLKDVRAITDKDADLVRYI